jgi:hypothetical protein
MAQEFHLIIWLGGFHDGPAMERFPTKDECERDPAADAIENGRNPSQQPSEVNSAHPEDPRSQSPPGSSGSGEPPH